MKKVLIISFLIFTMIISLFNISYAAKPVTISEDAFLEALLWQSNEYEFTVSPVDKENNIIKFFDLNDTPLCNVTYNLETLTFDIDVFFQKLLDIPDLRWRADLLNDISTDIYCAITNVCDVPYGNSWFHFQENLTSFPLEIEYDFDIEEYTSALYKDKNIPISELKNQSISIIKDFYSTKRVDSDKKTLNTFELTQKLKNTTKTSCTVNGLLKINRDYLTYNYYLNEPSNITTSNADKVIELCVGKTTSISLGNYKEYVASNDNCVVSESKKALNITGRTVGTTQISLYSHSKNKWDIETYYITVTPTPVPREVIIVPPTKTHYDVGEKLDLTGLNITVVYTDGDVKEISKGYTVKGYNKNKEGLQKITVDYEGFTRSFNVKVGNSSNIVVEDGENINNFEKLPQTGDFFDLKDGLYLLISILSIMLIYIVYKSANRKKIEK